MQGENWWREGAKIFTYYTLLFRANLLKLLPALNICPKKLFWNLEIRLLVHIYSDRQKVCVLDDLPSQSTPKCSYPTGSVLHPSVEKPHKAPFTSNGCGKPQQTQVWMLFAPLCNCTELRPPRRNSLEFLLACGKQNISFLFVRIGGQFVSN